jgi:NTP pyrophosphatase (non-canonical NTP hydrolase)
MQEDIISYLVENNSFNYNLTKTAEELNELAAELLKKVNKIESKQPSNDTIIEEIGDCEIRMLILNQLFSKQKIDERITYKLNKYHEYIQQGEMNHYKEI